MKREGGINERRWDGRDKVRKGDSQKKGRGEKIGLNQSGQPRQNINSDTKINKIQKGDNEH